MILTSNQSNQIANVEDDRQERVTGFLTPYPPSSAAPAHEDEECKRSTDYSFSSSLHKRLLRNDTSNISTYRINRVNIANDSTERSKEVNSVFANGDSRRDRFVHTLK